MLFNRDKTIPKIFIAGNQKSGTTAISSLIAHASGLSVQNDIPKFWPPYIFDYLEGKLSIEHFIKKYKRKFFNKDIVKEPNFSFFLSDLIRLYSKSQFIFVIRNPYDNIRSILNRRGIPGNLRNLESLGLKIDHRKTYIGHKYLWLENDDNYIAQQARKWLKIVNEYSKVEDKCLLVKYEDFLIDKIEVIDNLLKSFNLENKNSINELKDIQFQPKGDSNIDLHAFYGIDNLKIIEDICGSTMAKFNYNFITNK